MIPTIKPTTSIKTTMLMSLLSRFLYQFSCSTLNGAAVTCWCLRCYNNKCCTSNSDSSFASVICLRGAAGRDGGVASWGSGKQDGLPDLLRAILVVQTLPYLRQWIEEGRTSDMKYLGDLQEPKRENQQTA